MPRRAWPGGAQSQSALVEHQLPSTRTLNETATIIATSVEEQGAATLSIAQAVQQAAAGTTEVNSNIGAVTRVVAETDNRAGVVLDAALEMTGQATMLEDEAAKFLVAVQEASCRREARIQRRDACRNHPCRKGVTLTLHDAQMN
jgi:hypothetical protein